MKKGLLILLTAFCTGAAQAQSGVYSLASVPEALKPKASVITHLHQISVEVESIEKAAVKVQKIFTVVDEKGKDALLFREHSSKDIALDEAEIRVLNANGKQIARYKKKDMVTVATGEGLIEDGYTTYYPVPADTYPVTVVFEYTHKFRGTFFLPRFHYIYPGEAVVEAHFTARIPADIQLHHKSALQPLEPVITTEGKYRKYEWSVRNLPASAYEEGSGVPRNWLPHVSIVTTPFSYYGHQGDFTSWKSFGAWLGKLYAGLDELAPARQEFFRQLVAGAPNEREKVRLIYSYLQNNFRYVSIQLGLGGIQPFSAAFTDEKKYGDCKGLSNFMKAALKAVGIRSHVAIINSDYNGEPVDPSFPANSFNHVILCVPGAKDSIWLECTSNTSAFGHLGTNTENRYALLVTENGGALVPTPRSSAAANKLVTTTRITLKDDLSAETETEMNALGEPLEMTNELLKNNRDEQKKFLVFYLGYKEPNDFEITAAATEHQKSVKLAALFRKLPEFNAGSKQFIQPRIHKMWSSKLPAFEDRRTDFYFLYPFEHRDTAILRLPAGYKPDALPKDKELKTDVTYYAAKTWYNEAEGAIYTATVLILRNHKIRASDYKSVKTFFDEVMQDDAQRIVIRK
ncbi:MAG TPA: DUF3857 domain-containing protein [Chitinophagaceae bacterium]|jgi:hypothetical protein|nr:DUF3857 domain-containing protein [Chitinophagaceae bacterium]